MAHDDFHVEPVRGLPARPPEGEKILWQGAPSWWGLALSAFGIRTLAVLFAALAVWRGLASGLPAAVLTLIVGALAIAAFCGLAFILARTTVYTLTTKRVAMRVGAALTVTLNLPYRWIEAADFAPAPAGTGSIHLKLKGETRLSYLVCWPHVRPWRMGRTQPTLRAIPEPEKVATILRDAAAARLAELGTAVTTSETEAPAPAAAPMPAE
ncbi:MAG: photosynthetic complex putative assembly protein PuhB [Pseudomonadota bacterium]